MGTLLQAYQSRSTRPFHQDEWREFLSHLTFPRRLHTRMRRAFGRGNQRPDQLRKLQETVEQERAKDPYLQLLHRMVMDHPHRLK